MIIYGRNIVKEALKSEYPVFEIRITEEASKHLADMINNAKSRGIPIKNVKNQELDSYASGGVHQGVVAKVKDFPKYPIFPRVRISSLSSWSRN